MDNKLKILQINTQDARGGAAKVAWNLFNQYEKTGLSSYFAVGTKLTKHSNIFEIPKQHPETSWQGFWGDLETKTKSYVGKIKGAGRLGNIFHSVAWPKGFLGKISRKENFNFSGSRKVLELTPQKPDILHLHNLHGDYFDLRTLPMLCKKIPTIITLHDAWLLSGLCAHSFDCKLWQTGCRHCNNAKLFESRKRSKAAYNWNLKKQIFKQSNLHIATPCQWLMDKVDQSILSCAIADKRVIPNGIDLSIFKPATSDDNKTIRKKFDLPTSAFVILFAGYKTKSNPWKDYQTLEKALIDVSKKNSSKSEKIILVCVGEKNEAKKINNIEIRFIQYLDDEKSVATYYQIADVYVHPAKADTFPNVILEALACGTPVIATRIGGIPEQIIEHPLENTTGILVKEKNVADLSRAIITLLQNKQLRDKMAINARKDVVKRFDLRDQTKKYLEWYKEIFHAKTNHLNSSGNVQSSKIFETYDRKYPARTKIAHSSIRNNCR